MEVQTNENPHHTGLLIEKGSTVEVTASGEGFKFGEFDITRSYGPGGQNGNKAGQGWPDPGAQPYALLAQIGGDFYEVGSGLSFKSKNEGRLNFLFNDTKYTDNSGKPTVDLTVIRPEPDAGNPNATNEPDNKPSATNKQTANTTESETLNHTFLVNHLAL